MSLTVAQITTHVTRQFGDEAGSQITQADIIRWINEAMREIAHKNSLFQVKAKSDGVQGVSAYALPTGISKLFSVKYKGLTLQPVSIAEADSLVGDIDLSNAQGFPTGTPSHYWIWADQINLYPTPDSNDTDALVAYYTRQPTEVTQATDVPEVPDEYHNRILEYCMAQAYELDENFEVSNAKMAQFKQGVAEANDKSWESQETYPFITDSLEDSLYYG